MNIHTERIHKAFDEIIPSKDAEIKRLKDALSAMLYIMQKNEGEIQMNMPESIDYDNALKMMREYEKV